MSGRPLRRIVGSTRDSKTLSHPVITDRAGYMPYPSSFAPASTCASAILQMARHRMLAEHSTGGAVEDTRGTAAGRPLGAKQVQKSLNPRVIEAHTVEGQIMAAGSRHEAGAVPAPNPGASARLSSINCVQ